MGTLETQSVLGASSGKTLAVLAITSAIAVATIYLPQSLLADQARDLGVTNGAVGVLGLTVQLGYALGILLLVPLSDRVHPRVQVTVQSLILVGALMIAAVMPAVGALAVAFLLVGLVANIAQVLIPAARDLVSQSRSGSTTSVMVGSIVVGMFGGRILAGALVDSIGWRLVVVLFAGLLLAMLPLCRRTLDVTITARAPATSYRGLLIGTVRLARTSPVLVQSTLIQLLVFCTFNAFWSVMVLHLTSDQFGWNTFEAAMFGFVGIAAGVVTLLSGGVLDRVGPLPVMGFGLVLLLVATVGVAVLDTQVPWLFAGLLFLITLANQSVLSATQSNALAANPAALGQANTFFMAGVFVGGSAGALVGVVAYEVGQMRMVATVAIVVVVSALALWGFLARRKRKNPTVAPSTLATQSDENHCER